MLKFYRDKTRKGAFISEDTKSSKIGIHTYADKEAVSEHIKQLRKALYKFQHITDSTYPGETEEQTEERLATKQLIKNKANKKL